MQEFKRVACNEDVVKRLKVYLNQAEKGEMRLIGLVAVEGDRYTSDFCGDASAFYMANFALDQLKQKLIAGIESTHLAPTTTGVGNMFHYDISKEPVNFDFVVWMATCEMIRRREKAPAPLRIGFSTSEGNKFLSKATTDYRNKFLVNVFGPALEFFGAVNDPEAVIKGRRSNMYTLRGISEAARAGEEVPRIMVPPEAMEAVAQYLNGRQPLVVTLRENASWEHRNSNLNAWKRFARESGEDVIFLRDTSEADKPFDDFEIYPLASKDLTFRAALYEQARCNFFVTNGPAILAHFGSRPWLTFITLRDDEPYYTGRPEWWRKNQGVLHGDQFPWALPTQRIIWKDDTFENITEAWIALKTSLNGLDPSHQPPLPLETYSHA